MTRALFWPTVRVARLDRIATTVLLGSIPLLVTALRHGEDLLLPSIILGVVTGASVGWIADDPTGEVLTPCPVNAPRRLGYRLLLASATLIVACGTAMAVAAVAGSPTPQWTERVPEATFAGLVALAGGFAVMRRGEPLGGVTGVTAGLLLPGSVAALAFRWPTHLPSFGASPVHSRWWLLSTLAALAAAHGSSDPVKRSLLRPAREDR